MSEHSASTVHDIVILGGGSGGYACALRAAQLGLDVVLIEEGKLGGTCLHQGCIPTKALLHSAEVADSAREGHQFGVKSTLEGIDMAAVNAYKDGVVSRLYKGLSGSGQEPRCHVRRGPRTPGSPRHRRRRRHVLHRSPRRARDRFGPPVVARP